MSRSPIASASTAAMGPTFRLRSHPLLTPFIFQGRWFGSTSSKACLCSYWADLRAIFNQRVGFLIDLSRCKSGNGRISGPGQEKVTVQIWYTIMRHRFSVLLALAAVGSLGSLSHLARAPQPVAQPLSPQPLAITIDLDAVANSAYIHPGNRRGSGRRRVRG